MTQKFSMETVREIWNDRYNEGCIEVGPDRDCLGLVEIRKRDDDKNAKIFNRMTFTTEQAQLVAQALTACANELERKVGTA